MIVSRRGSELQHANIHNTIPPSDQIDFSERRNGKKQIKHDQTIIVTDLSIFRGDITHTSSLAPVSAFKLVP